MVIPVFGTLSTAWQEAIARATGFLWFRKNSLNLSRPHRSLAWSITGLHDFQKFLQEVGRPFFTSDHFHVQTCLNNRKVDAVFLNRLDFSMLVSLTFLKRAPLHVKALRESHFTEILAPGRITLVCDSPAAIAHLSFLKYYCMILGCSHRAGV